MKSVDYRTIEAFEDDVLSVAQYRPALRRRLMISAISLFIAFASGIYLLVTHHMIVGIPLLLMSVLSFIWFQRMRPIACQKCGRKYVFRSTNLGGGERVMGVCFDCKIKCSTGVELTSA